MGEETRVKTSGKPEIASTHHHARARGPQHLGRIIILAVIVLNSVKYAPPTKRVAVTVYISAAGPGILERVTILLGQQLRLACRHISMAVHKFHQRSKPMM